MVYSFLRNYRKYIGICAVSLTVSAAAIGMVHMDRVMQEKETVFVDSVAGAGISTIISDAVSVGDDAGQEAIFTAGITDVLNAYYNRENDKYMSPSVAKIERIVNMVAANTAAGNDVTEFTVGESEVLENQTEETVAEEPVTEEPTTEAAENQEVTSIVSEYTVLGVANVTNYLNVREEPDLGGKILGKLPMNAGCEILEVLDGWYKIHSGEVEGYCSAEYVLTGEEANERAKSALTTVVRVNVDKLMVREHPTTESTILTKVAKGEELRFKEQLDGWTMVEFSGKTGYVATEYVDVYNTLPKGVTLKQLSYGDGVSNTAVDLIEYAKQFLGNPYVWGGTSLTNGTDCSGFTMRVFQHFGYSLSRTSRTQANNGTRVSLSEIRPGDLLFYSYGGTIGHVAIYIGNGKIIHASSPSTGIMISNAFWTTPCCATRILN